MAMLSIYKDTYSFELFEKLSKKLKDVFDISDESVETEKSNLQKIYRRYRPWQRIPSFKGIDFDDSEKRCAYMQHYAACHMALARHVCVELIESSAEFKAFVQRTDLDVLSFGGGPGNDLLGFAGAIYSENSSLEALYLTVVDRCSGWEEVFGHVLAEAKSGEYGDVSRMLRSVEVGSYFVHKDVCEDCDTDNLDSSLEEADIIIMTKVLSNVPSGRKKTILKHTFTFMRAEAIFVYIDIDSDVVRDVASGYPMKVLSTSGRRCFSPSLPIYGYEANVFSSYEVYAAQTFESSSSESSSSNDEEESTQHDSNDSNTNSPALDVLLRAVSL